jgi:Protein of unknown function (DUF3455)
LTDKDANVTNTYTDDQRSTWAVLLITGVAALGATLAVTAQAGHDRVSPPPVPAKLEVEPGHEAFLVGHAIGTQNYVCLPSATGFAWSLFTPEATLFGDDDRQITTHFFGPNPFEGGTIRAVWQHSRDTSTVWGRVDQSSTDSQFVAPGAIPWLLVNVKDVGAQAGPTGGRRLTKTTFIHRLNTVGGVAPATGCAQAGDVGNRRFVPYTADYFFYEKATHHGHHDD